LKQSLLSYCNRPTTIPAARLIDSAKDNIELQVNIAIKLRKQPREEVEFYGQATLIRSGIQAVHKPDSL
jgi:hypothetical protein